MALVDVGKGFLDLLSRAELAFSPVLMDAKEITEVDLLLVEGSVRNEEDRHLLAEARDKAQCLVAFGTCATFGGVPGLANRLPVDDLLGGIYGLEALGEGVPAPCAHLLPLDSYTEVDCYIPGCPPPSRHLGDILAALVTGSDPPRIETPVRSECQRTAGPEPLEALARPLSKAPEPEKCLLVQGFLCMGSVTRGGCGAACTAVHVPYTGCRGPTNHLPLESRHGIYRDIVSRISHLLDMPVREVEGQLTDLPHTLYAHSLASQALRRKDAERVSRFVYRIKE